MKINKRLLSIKSHYFLRYAGSAFLTLALPIMVRQKRVSEQGIGFLWSLMPMVGLITNSVSGTLADYFRAHRTVFLMSLTFLTTSLTVMYFLPSIPISEDAELARYQDMGQFPNRSTINDTWSAMTAPNELPQNLSYLPPSKYVPSSSSFTNSKEGLKDEFFKTMVDPDMIVEEGQAFPPSLRVSTEREPSSSEDASMLSNLMKYPQFWLICLAMMVEQMGISTCVMISDAVCFQILGKERHKYGEQRLWGTIGMGIMAIVIGALVDLYSRGLPQTDYLPAIIICIVFMTADIIVVSKMKIPYNHEKRMKMGDVGSVIAHPQTIIFIMTVYVMGTSLGLLWVFKLMHIEDVTKSWDPNFPNLRLLLGLDMGIETFGGEVPFFFLSGIIILKMGHTLVFALSLAALAVRCCLYYAVTNPWWFLPIELLNGVSYGLFHTCMASFASHIAPEGAQATLQAIVRASLTIGQASAGFLGGILYQKLGGAKMFLSVGLFDVGFCIFFGIMQALITKYYDNTKLFGKKGYEVPSRNNSSSGDSSQESHEVGENGTQDKETKRALMDNV